MMVYLVPYESVLHEDSQPGFRQNLCMHSNRTAEVAVFPTRHAIQRFQERVAPVTTAEAARRIRDLAASSVVCKRPRRWTPAVAGPGLTFLYPAATPGVCLLVRDGAVLTVFERSMAKAWARAQEPPVGRMYRLEPYRRPSPGSPLAEAA